jgi:hypothetical protein
MSIKYISAHFWNFKRKKLSKTRQYSAKEDKISIKNEALFFNYKKVFHNYCEKEDTINVLIY